MYNKQIADIVSKYERLSEWYNIGPVQKCILEDFVDEIVKTCAENVHDHLAWTRMSYTATEVSEVIKKTFD